jgi:hypothetical protein
MKSSLFLAGCMSVMLNAPAQSLPSLERSTDWQRLLVYEADRASPSGLRSAIHSPDFFLSAQGETDPGAELKATLSAMLAPLSGPNDDHAKCRFPARRIWLQQHLPGQAAALDEIECPAFRAWAKPDQIDSISLVFANGYLGNPASYYGHTFLKFNHSKASGTSSLLDSTLNYGAITKQQDDPVSYIIKGIAGGYEGGFSPIDYYFHDATYGEDELRDMWEYRLALPEPATRLIIAHAWEVTQKKYTYYFFRRNCAYRVAELIEIASGLEIIPRHRPWVMPQELIRRMARTSYAGTPLVSARIYHPSRQARLYRRYAALSGPERALTGSIIARTAAPAGPQMAALPVERRQAIIDTLLDYHQFRLERGKNAPGNRSTPEYVEALNARFALPPGDSEAPQPQPQPEAPDSGRAPSYVQAGISHTSSHGQAIELRIRPAYYDALDSGGAQARNSALSMFDIYLASERGHWRIRRLDLLAIDSMNAAVTGLPGDRGTGWRLALGLDEERIGCTSCRVARVQGDVGIGHAWQDARLAAALHAGGGVQAGAAMDGWGFARIGASLVWRLTPRFGLRLGHEIQRPFRQASPAIGVTQAEARLALGTEYDLRLRWDRDERRDQRRRVMLAVGRYW